MATPAYVPLNPNVPSGPTQTPADYSASDLANVRALRDMVVSGLGLPGCTFGQNPTNSILPTYYAWDMGAGRYFYASMTYAGAPHYQPLTCQFAYSADAGASQVNVGPVCNFTFDAVAGTLHTASNMAGLFTQFLANRAYGVWLEVRANNHAAGVGNQVHGLGTIAVQNANNVALTGGAINGTLQSGNIYVQMARVAPQAPQALANGVPWDWGGNSGVQYNAAPGIALPYIVGPAAGEVKRIWVTAAGAITIGTGGGVTFAWATGYPVWNAAGGTLVCCVAISGGFVLGTTVP